MKTLSFCTLLLFSFNACREAPAGAHDTFNGATAVAKPDTITAASPDTVPYPVNNKVMDAVYALPEVKALSHEINKGPNRFLIWINDTPSAEHKYYWVKVGEDNGSNFVTTYHFFVYPDSMRVMYYDVASDSAISLAAWRGEEK